MKRDLAQLTDREFDVLVIGAGIYGAAAAWEAASRGLSVAVLEKADFASATSANSLKIIHGGFRYLQNLDLPRVRESMLERKILMRIAPGLVQPLPVLVPTQGHGQRGREALAAALQIYDLLCFDRNGLDDPGKFIPRGRLLGVQDCRERAPELAALPLNGCALFYDALVTDSERLVLGYLHSAAGAGAVIANRVEVTGFLRRGDAVGGVQAVDRLGGTPFAVRARLVLNTAGPWVRSLIEQAVAGKKAPRMGLAKAVNLVTAEPVFENYAVGLVGDNGYRDDASRTPGRSSLLFVVPWRGRSMIGTSYRPYSGDPGELQVSEADIRNLLESFNQAFPGQRLSREQVAYVHAGLLPALPGDGAVRLTRHPAITRHDREGLAGLVSVEGVKYTTARRVAQRVVDGFAGRLERPPGPSISAFTPLQLYGQGAPDELPLGEQPAPADLTRAVLHAIREEMALSLEDIILRRTGLGTAGKPDPAVLQSAALTMAGELGWDEARKTEEIKRVEKIYVYGSSTGMATEAVPQIRAQAA